ncbi:MAG: hypothetical protein IPO20_06460 [Gammaproteobacteria bacterium]|nr:hypothetical protein [Gammaproteobacteria bacterium]
MRPSIVIAFFAAGLLAGVIGSTMAADPGKRDLSAAGEGAWILGPDSRVTYCWTRSNPTGSKEIDCTVSASP